jgi:aspartate aminotransferase-like enzyme
MQFTPPVQIVYALDQALREFEAEGGAAGRWVRYQRNFQALDSGMRELGFRRLLPEAILSRILTAYLEPDHPNYSFEAMHDRLYAKGFTIYPGKGAQRDTFRLANMGAVDERDMRNFVAAMHDTLRELGVQPLYASE